MVNHLVFRWPKPLFFMVLGAHGVSYTWSYGAPINGWNLQPPNSHKSHKNPLKYGNGTGPACGFSTSPLACGVLGEIPFNIAASFCCIGST